MKRTHNDKALGWFAACLLVLAALVLIATAIIMVAAIVQMWLIGT